MCVSLSGLKIYNFGSEMVCNLYRFCWYLKTILLCIVGELAGGGLWLLALVTCDR